MGSGAGDELAGCAARRSTAGSVAPEAAWRLGGDDVVELEIDDGLEGLPGGAVAGGVGDCVEPACIVGLQGDELGDGGVPSLRAGAPVGGSAEAADGGGGVAGAIAGLALGTGEGCGPSGLRPGGMAVLRYVTL